MSGKTDVVERPRLRTAAGALTGNDKLRGRRNRPGSSVKTKQAVQQAADTVKKAVKKVIG